MPPSVLGLTLRDLCVLSKRVLALSYIPSPVVLFCSETGFPYIAEVDLELEIFSPLPPSCWDYRLCTHVGKE